MRGREEEVADGCHEDVDGGVRVGACGGSGAGCCSVLVVGGVRSHERNRESIVSRC